VTTGSAVALSRNPRLRPAERRVLHVASTGVRDQLLITVIGHLVGVTRYFYPRRLNGLGLLRDMDGRRCMLTSPSTFSTPTLVTELFRGRT
jgi:hypothetical protein